jgi:hypothetical protein
MLRSEVFTQEVRVQRSTARPWLFAALLAGVAYVVIGRAFAVPSTRVRASRIAAWLVSLGVYATHFAYEHIRLRHPARSAALHVALGVALGAFGLAAAGAVLRRSSGRS